ncbi:MAG: glycosyltransferase family A protein [Cloacibacillus sp.]
MKFSIIIPVYNKASTVEQTIKSVLNQTYTNYELVVVNDGSTDGVEDVLKQYINEQVVIVNQSNSGVSCARNTGIKKSNGEYICFLDADDIWRPNRLETLVRMIKSYPGEKLFATPVEIILPNGKRVHTGRFLKENLKDMVLIEDFFDLYLRYSSIVFNTDTICIHKDVFKKVGLFEPGETIGEDTDMWFRAAAYYPIVFAKETTAVYNRMESTATKNDAWTYSWRFAKRNGDILNDSGISQVKKKHILRVIDRYHMSCCRRALFEGSRSEAIVFLKSVHCKRNWRYAATLMCFCVPHRLLKLAIC